MADIIINAKHQQRHDTEANWTSKDPVLLDGEMGFVTGTQKYKIGDGTSKWSALAYHTSLTDTEKSKLDGIATGANKTTVDSALSSTSTNPVQNKVINTALSGKANSSHTHDDRYYTETEINSKLSGKSDTNHTHNQYYDSGVTRTANTFLAAPNGKDGTASFRVLAAADIPTITKSKISDFAHSHNDLYYSKTDVDNKLSAKANSSHIHDDRYYTETEINTKLSGKANSSHTHDDRYYTESEMDGKLSGKANTNHTHDLSAMINGLDEATATPSDADYFVSQYAGGGTTNTSYFRKPVSALWNFIKSKLATVAISGSYNDLSNKPSIPSVGNGTVTIKQNGASKGSFTMNQSGSTTIELTDNNTNTWRDVVNNLASTATDKSLSAAQGKILNESKLMHKTINTSKTDFNSLTETGIYHITITDALNAPISNHGTLYVDAIVGTKYQVFMGDTVTDRIFKRIYNGTNKAWTTWTTQKLTDTVYTHPNYTAKSSGFYKVTVDSTGHVSGTTAVTKGDITALGIPSTNTTYSTGTASTSGITKLYTGTGTATDGTMTQSAIKSALDGKSNNGHTHDDRYYTESEMNTKLSGKSDTSHTHNRIVSRGDVTAETGADGRPAVEGLSMSQAYNNGYPTSYGNVINLRGAGDGQILVGWSGSDKGYAPVYVRNKRDNTTTADWSSWQQFYTTGYKPTKADVGLGNVDNTADSAKSVKYANSAGNASKVNNHTVNSDVPSGAKFTDTVYSHPTTSGNKHIPSGGSSGQILRWSADGTAVWGADNNTIYSDMKGATTSAAGKAGLVPAPAAGKQGQFLRGDGTWATPADTNTWRGIQNNLTSTATDQSLSAYQGKLLNEKIKNRILFQSSEPTTQSENDIWIKTTKL